MKEQGPPTHPGKEEKNNYSQLPADLPVPTDDGGCRHLLGLSMPSVTLSSTSGRSVNLAQPRVPLMVVYCYPMTGTPGEPLPSGWDTIPGARGCTPETCAFRDYYGEMKKLGAELFGVSTQSTEDQREMVSRLRVPFAVLSDQDLALTRALNLPIFEIDGQTYIKRLTLILRHGRIDHVFYPVFPPDAHAGQILEWLMKNSASV